MKDLHCDTRAGIAAAFSRAADFFLGFPVKHYHGYRIVGSDGDYLRNTKNVKGSYFTSDAKDGRYLYNVYLDTEDSYDFGPWGAGASQMYECLTCGDHCERERFCFESWSACRDLDYCCFLRSSADCFGCVSLKNAQYCIFNKQYSKDEYFALRDKIIAQMNAMPYRDEEGREYRYGEFFPPALSPFAYNEVELQDVFPLTKEQATAKRLPWRDPDVRDFTTTVIADRLPDAAVSADDTIVKELIQCAECKRAYRIVDQELQFLRRLNLPLPSRCVNCRAARRSALVNRPVYHHRQCQCAGGKSQNGRYANTSAHDHGDALCPNEFETSYAPDRPEIVYCESCYNAEVA